MSTFLGNIIKRYYSILKGSLKFLKEHFNANNPAHLVSITKDLGLI